MHIKNTLLFISVFFISFQMIAQTSLEWSYISPKANSEYINPENTIAFRQGEELDFNSFAKELLSIVGSKSGNVDFEALLSNNSRTLIIQPVKSFELNEIVKVHLKKGIKTKSGKTIGAASTSFTTRGKQPAAETNDQSYHWINSSGKVPEEHVFSYDNLITYGDASLPDDLPTPQITVYNNPSDELVFLGVEPQSNRYNTYAVIIDKFGTPVFYRQWPSKTVNLQVSAGNKIIHKDQLPSGFDKNCFLVLNNKYEPIDTLQVGNGYKTNTHDGILLENGNHFLMIYDSQLVGMDTVVPGGNPDATVKGFVFQELDPDHNVIFQWRSWDHVEITDANNVNLLAATVDYIHVNAFDTTADGNFLLCCRHFDEITKIDLNSGDIIWRFGPHSQNNMFEITNDTLGFTYPHDIQELSNGNITMYDNGNFHENKISSAVEYELDEANMKASLVYRSTREPSIFGPTKGSTRRQSNGNTLIGWGNNFPVVATEVNSNNDIEWELSLDSCISYRAMSFNWETMAFTTNVNEIDFGYYNGYEPWPVLFQVTNNMDKSITITSASHHSEAFTFETQLPVNIGAGQTSNMMLSFYPEGMGELDFEDILTLNSDGFFSDTLKQRISRQIKLKGTTIDHSGINDKYNEGLNVYPNPVLNGELAITSDKINIASYRISDVSGRLMLQKKDISTMKEIVEIDAFPPGIYILTVLFTDGTEGKPYKLVVR